MLSTHQLHHIFSVSIIIIQEILTKETVAFSLFFSFLIRDSILNMSFGGTLVVPYSDKRKQLLQMTFLVNEQNVSAMYIDINAISLYLDLNICQQAG